MRYGYFILSLLGILYLGNNCADASDFNSPKRPSVTIGANRAPTDNPKQPSWRSSQQFNCISNCTSFPAMHCYGPNSPGYYDKCIKDCEKTLSTNPSYKEATKKCEEFMQKKKYLGQIIDYDYDLPFSEPGTFGSRGFLVKVLRQKTAPHLGVIDFTEHNDNIIAFLPYENINNLSHNPENQPIEFKDFIGKMIEFNKLDTLGLEKFTSAQLEVINQDDKNKNYMNNDYKAFFSITSEVFDTLIKANREDATLPPNTVKSHPLEKGILPID